MAGLISSASSVLRLAANIEKNGVAEGTIKTLEDKNIALARADGSMLKVLAPYIVEPVAVVSSDLKGTEELDSILGLHMDMFVGYYMQVFEVLRNNYDLDMNTTIALLSTDKSGLDRLAKYGTGKLISLAKEDNSFHDFLGEMLLDAELSTESGSDKPLNAREQALAAAMVGRKPSATTRGSGKKEVLRTTNTGYSKLDKGATDLLIPQAMSRVIELSTVIRGRKTSDGPVEERTLTATVNVNLSVIFSSKESILEAIETKDDKYSFSNRLDDYRSGAISLLDFLAATDVINKYKSKKIKGRDELERLIKSREFSANAKILSNKAIGFEKYYNMYIISPETKTGIERTIKSKLSTPKGKEKFLERANGLSVTVMDPDYERIQIMLKDLRGSTDMSFRAAIKKDKGGSDYSEIIKALMANKPPAF